MHDWKQVTYKWGIAFLVLSTFCNRIVSLSCPGTRRAIVKIGHSNLRPGSKELCTATVDEIHNVTCYGLDKYKSVHKAAVPSMVVSNLRFVKTFFNCEMPPHFPLLNILKLNGYCFIIYTHVDNAVTFPNMYGLYVV